MLDPEMTVINTTTIAAGDNDSGVICKKHYRNMAIFLPANWVTSVITFKGCDTPDGTFIPIVKGSTALAVTIASVAASKCIVLDDMILKAIEPVPYIIIVSTQAQITTDKVIHYCLSR